MLLHAGNIFAIKKNLTASWRESTTENIKEGALSCAKVGQNKFSFYFERFLLKERFPAFGKIPRKRKKKVKIAIINFYTQLSKDNILSKINGMKFPFGGKIIKLI
jgi:hypothetical protein